MTGAAMLAVLAVGSVVAAHMLTAARWTWRAPRSAIALWQAVGFAWGVAAVGALVGFGVAPYERGVAGGLMSLATDRDATRLGPLHVAALAAGVALAAVLLAVLVVAAVGVVRVRRRHRALLALVAHGEPGLAGALVVDHPAAAAYCVPGVRSQVVVSAGTLRLLDRAELAAVLAHERAHARERHDLVLLPFASLLRVFPQTGIVARAVASVELLVEMAADDRARQTRPARELATALLRFAAAGPAPSPSGTLGIAETPVLTRVRRLIDPAPPPYGARAMALVGAALLALLPAVLYALPA
jgi:beta-lactamase regulating signal transducer with metallopeptidase domain